MRHDVTRFVKSCIAIESEHLDARLTKIRDNPLRGALLTRARIQGSRCFGHFYFALLQVGSTIEAGGSTSDATVYELYRFHVKQRWSAARTRSRACQLALTLPCSATRRSEPSGRRCRAERHPSPPS